MAAGHSSSDVERDTYSHGDVGSAGRKGEPHHAERSAVVHWVEVQNIWRSSGARDHSWRGGSLRDMGEGIVLSVVAEPTPCAAPYAAGRVRSCADGQPDVGWMTRPTGAVASSLQADADAVVAA